MAGGRTCHDTPARGRRAVGDADLVEHGTRLPGRREPAEELPTGSLEWLCGVLLLLLLLLLL